MQDTAGEGQIEKGDIVRVERAAPAREFGQVLSALISDGKLSPEQARAVMEVRREVLRDEAHEAFDAAYVAMQAELPEVERDGTIELIKDGVSKGRIPFSTYEQIYKVIRPIMGKYGFAVRFASEDRKDEVVMRGWLIGHGWQSEPSSWSLPPDAGPGRNALQARGSSRQYAKRYITEDLLNIVRKGKDDDGRGAMEALIDATQVKELTDLIKATGTNEQQFLKLMVTSDTVMDIRQRDFPRLVMALRDKQRKMKK